MNIVRPTPLLIRQMLSRGWSACIQTIADLLFPWSCLVCGLESDECQGPICPDCRASLLASFEAYAVRACPRCAQLVGPHADLRGGCSKCRSKSLGFAQAIALGPYEDSLRLFCLSLKREPNAWMAPWLSALLFEVREQRLRELPRDTWVVPVPLHWRRRIQRGYNQADALASSLARRLGLAFRRPLRRIRPTDRLAELAATERIRAMRGAFGARRRAGLKGRTILLVDDILTTGATAGAAARALKQAGARRVVLVVLARAL